MADLTSTRYVSTTTSSIVTQLQETSKLTSMSMTVVKIIESKKEFENLIPGLEIEQQIRNTLFGDRLIMTVEGVVNAGIDLSYITPEDVTIVVTETGKIATIRLPAAEIFDAYLTENTKPFERSLWLLSKGNHELETTMRNTAVDTIRKQALEEDILSKATESAKATLTTLIQSIDPALEIEWRVSS